MTRARPARQRDFVFRNRKQQFRDFVELGSEELADLLWQPVAILPAAGKGFSGVPDRQRLVAGLFGDLVGTVGRDRLERGSNATCPAISHRAKMNGLAALGQWKSDLEKKAA